MRFQWHTRNGNFEIFYNEKQLLLEVKVSEGVVIRGQQRNKFLQIIFEITKELLWDIYKWIAKLVDKETTIQNHYLDFQKIKIYLAERCNINLREYSENIIIKFIPVNIINKCLNCDYLLYFINATLISAKYLNSKHY